mmetsp:Transcript_81782/g.226565  ORF Transcript_81782/g.226565 Transcript_81782/m.226565 type:complete len:508 (+) Transcript_81782:189-1712(+)
MSRDTSSGPMPSAPLPPLLCSSSPSSRSARPNARWGTEARVSAKPRRLSSGHGSPAWRSEAAVVPASRRQRASREQAPLRWPAVASSTALRKAAWSPSFARAAPGASSDPSNLCASELPPASGFRIAQMTSSRPDGTCSSGGVSDPLQPPGLRMPRSHKSEMLRRKRDSKRGITGSTRYAAQDSRRKRTAPEGDEVASGSLLSGTPGCSAMTSSAVTTSSCTRLKLQGSLTPKKRNDQAAQHTTSPRRSASTVCAYRKKIHAISTNRSRNLAKTGARVGIVAAQESLQLLVSPRPASATLEKVSPQPSSAGTCTLQEPEQVPDAATSSPVCSAPTGVTESPSSPSSAVATGSAGRSPRGPLAAPEQEPAPEARARCRIAAQMWSSTSATRAASSGPRHPKTKRTSAELPPGPRMPVAVVPSLGSEVAAAAAAMCAPSGGHAASPPSRRQAPHMGSARKCKGPQAARRQRPAPLQCARRRFARPRRSSCNCATGRSRRSRSRRASAVW